MNIRFGFSSINAAVFFNKETFSSITIQQKKILMIVSIALGFIAVCCVGYCRFFKAKKGGIEKAPNDDQKKIPSAVKSNVDESKPKETNEREIKINSDEKEKDLLQNGTHTDAPTFEQPKQEEVEGDATSSFLSKNSDRFPGKEKRILSNGEIHEGDFLKGQLISGVKTHPNGKIEQGEFKDDRLIKGTITWPPFAPGSIQIIEEGEFNKLGVLQGQGKKTYFRGKISKVFEGLFDNGLPKNLPDSFFDDFLAEPEEGDDFLAEPEETELDIETSNSVNLDASLSKKGKKEDSQGIIYEGDFLNDLFVSGVKTYPIGRQVGGKLDDREMINGEKTYFGCVEEGNFSNNKLEGKGKRTFKTGEIQEGDFKDGLLVLGQRKYHLGLIEDGEFVEDRLIKGKKTFLGRIEEGEFNLWDVLTGQGKTTHPDGRVEDGIFGDGSLEEGSITHLDGRVEEGIFRDGSLKKGTITHPDGKLEKVLFIDDDLIFDQ
jgi:hypothetical protein